MNRIMIILISILICSSCFAAYDANAVEYLVGGFGFSEANSGDPCILTLGLNRTYSDYGQSAAYSASNCQAVMSGTLSRIKIRFYRGDDPHGILSGEGNAVFCVFDQNMTGNGATFPKDFANGTLANSSVDISLAVYNAAMAAGANTAFTLDLDVSSYNIAVTATNLFGIFLNDPGTSHHLYLMYRQSYLGGAGDTTNQHICGTGYTGVPLGLTVWDASSYGKLHAALIWEIYAKATVQTSTVTASTATNRQYRLPTCPSTPYHIIVERVAVANNANCKISLKGSGTDSATTNEKTIEISYDGGTDSNKICLYSGDTPSNTVSQAITGQTADSFNLDLWVDPVNKLCNVMFVNVQHGQGGAGSIWDIKHSSINGRGIRTAMTLTNIKEVNIVGGTLTNTKIYVVRKPVVLLCDSFGSTNDGTVLTLGRVGARLDNSFAAGGFTLQKYVINGGMASNAVLYNKADATTNLTTAMRTRWNDANSHQDLCDYNNVVYEFLNGPGLNDVLGLVTTTAGAQRISGQIASDVGRMVGEAITNGNDVVMNNMIPYPTGDAPKQLCIQMINDALRTLAVNYQVPYADVSAYPYSLAGDVHPSSDGELYISGQIRAAYENNIMATKPVQLFKLN